MDPGAMKAAADKGPADKAAGDSAAKNPKKKRRNYQNKNARANRNPRPNKFYGKNRIPGGNGGGGDRRYSKRPRFEVGERLKDIDLGITEYIGNCEGFTGTIKERFTDFQVREISLNGDVAKLTDQEIPDEPEEIQNLDELKKKVPEHVWNQLQDIDENTTLEIDVTDLDKDQRKTIHTIVKTLTKVFSETVETNGKKFIVFCKPYSKRGDVKLDQRVDWSNRGGDYCHFILHKVNMDTMEALGQLARNMFSKQNFFTYAGTKDRRAKTSQWISIKKTNPAKIAKAARWIKGAYVGNFKYEKNPLKLGQLEGNRFSIALRNVTAPDELINESMKSFQDNGFVNYYGLQRFGTIAAIPTYEIGKLLLQAKWNEAIELILKPRNGEQDLSLADARKVYQETQDPFAAYQKIGRQDKVEAKLLWGLHKSGKNNPQGALDFIPRNTLLMYIHSYQSFVWNKIVSRRIREFGLKPVAGDLVYEDPISKDDSSNSTLDMHQENNKDANLNVSTSDQEPTEVSENVKTDGEETALKKTTTEISKTDKKTDKEEENQLPKVKVLTDENFSKYKITDVVMPLPGYKVTYPNYAKTWYEEYLEKDGLNVDLKQKNKKYTLGGSYRKIVQVPRDLQWKIMRFSEKNQDLIPSDFDEMRGIKAPENKPDGKFKALLVDMSLSSSSYATMALREITKYDTSAQTHAAQSEAFQKEHEKNEESTKNDASIPDSNIREKTNLTPEPSELDSTQILPQENVVTVSHLEGKVVAVNIDDSGIEQEV